MIFNLIPPELRVSIYYQELENADKPTLRMQESVS